MNTKTWYSRLGVGSNAGALAVPKKKLLLVNQKKTGRYKKGRIS
jgi:hypothetical protein